MGANMARQIDQISFLVEIKLHAIFIEKNLLCFVLF